MDWGSISGLALAIISILLGQAVEGGSVSSLLQPAAFIVVVFGTLGAVLLQSKPKNFFNAIYMLRQVFITPDDDRSKLARRISLWGAIARKEGIMQLEGYLQTEKDPFIQKGLRLMIDGIPPQTIKDICKNDLDQYESSQRSAIKVWDSAGGYSPTIGILGAVLGLIHVMENLSDPNMLGSGIAVAFVATIYGVGLANMVFIPIANKLKAIMQLEITRREMLMEALTSIANGEHSIMIEERLSSYLR